MPRITKKQMYADKLAQLTQLTPTTISTLNTLYTNLLNGKISKSPICVEIVILGKSPNTYTKYNCRCSMYLVHLHQHCGKLDTYELVDIPLTDLYICNTLNDNGTQLKLSQSGENDKIIITLTADLFPLTSVVSYPSKDLIDGQE